MSDGSGSVMRTELADLGITVVKEFDELLLSVPHKSRIELSRTSSSSVGMMGRMLLKGKKDDS